MTFSQPDGSRRFTTVYQQLNLCSTWHPRGSRAWCSFELNIWKSVIFIAGHCWVWEIFLWDNFCFLRIRLSIINPPQNFVKLSKYPADNQIFNFNKLLTIINWFNNNIFFIKIKLFLKLIRMQYLFYADWNSRSVWYLCRIQREFMIFMENFRSDCAELVHFEGIVVVLFIKITKWVNLNTIIVHTKIVVLCNLHVLITLLKYYVYYYQIKFSQMLNSTKHWLN